MPDGDIPPPHGGGKSIRGLLGQTTAGLPNWAWLLVVAGGIAAAYLVPKFLGKSSGATGTDQAGQGIGLAVDPTTGLPYAVSGLVPSGGGVGTGGGSSTSGTTSTAPPQQYAATLRGPITSGWGQGWDIPIRSSPGGAILGYLSPGGSTQILNNPLTGPNNFGSNMPAGVGSTTWYPVQGGGYISGFDIASINGQSFNSQGLVSSAWPGGTTQVRTQ